jgi:nicotinate-nucleotide adenylyltransferase
VKVGVLGGTFDPIHHGHLVAAEEVRWKLSLDRVLFVPAGQPPHKLGQTVSPVSDRVAMVALAIAGNAGFALSRVDVDRPGPSYSVDMLAALQGQLGPGAELFFIIGLDSLADLLTWHEPSRLVQHFRIVAVTRPGYDWYDLASLEPAIPQARERITIVSVPALDIAASDLRRRFAEGRPIRYQVPEGVEEYIRARRLYAGGPGASSGSGPRH